jgi:hypothetical protein
MATQPADVLLNMCMNAIAGETVRLDFSRFLSQQGCYFSVDLAPRSFTTSTKRAHQNLNLFLPALMQSLTSKVW